ncbi:MAG TPA: BamA/TamA family outer membrane protein [Chitinophagales bacterium]|nr:BamA/TamA family outer membrane protein [Chitinophagales bacterium]
MLFLLSIKISSAQFHHQHKNKKIADSTTNNYIIIQHITLEGNRRTRDEIIFRELTFLPGDTIAVDQLMKQLEVSRNQVVNTGLFNEVVVNIKKWVNDSVDVSVSVKERWYILPLPTANLYDRSFNVWWVEHDHDIRWIQAGIHFNQKNVTGRNDELQATVLFGFQRRFDITYILPYFDYIQKHGLSVSASFTQSRSITYAIDSNKELIHEDVNTYQRSVFQTSLDFSYKPKFNYRYSASLGYRYSKVQDTIAELNPDYFLQGKTTQKYLSLRIGFTRDFRDIRAYPLRGSFLDVSAAKLGLGFLSDLDLWEASVSFNEYFQLGRKWFMSSQNKMKFSIPTAQPYNLQRGLGYANNYVTGYEYYAIDGQNWGYTKLDLKNEIFKIKLHSLQNNVFVKGADLPFGLYGRVFTSAGYVSNAHSSTHNTLDNHLLLGGGIGVDLTLLYDTTLRFEYSINKLGEHGLFFHLSSYF